MTTKTPAQAAQQNNRDPKGQYAEKAGSDPGTAVVTGTKPTHDIFGNELGRGGFPRDRWRRALVADPMMVGRFLPYRPPSSVVVSSYTENLETWQQNQMLRAVAVDRDFPLDLAAADLDDRDVMDAMRERAHEIARSYAVRDRGTFAHWMMETDSEDADVVERVSRGEAVGVDPEFADRIVAGWRDTAEKYGFETIAVEQQVVNDSMGTAGTMDRVLRIGKPLRTIVGNRVVTIDAGTVLAADFKFGQLRTDKHGDPRYYEKYAGQLAAYAGSVPYDAVTGERYEWEQPLHPDLGLIIHGDLEAIGNGNDRDGFHVFVLDLNKGRKLADASQDLRNAEKQARDVGRRAFPAA